MGNMVIFAVKHDDLKSVSSLGSINRLTFNDSSFEARLPKDGVICSRYYDYMDNANLYISSEGVRYIGCDSKQSGLDYFKENIPAIDVLTKMLNIERENIMQPQEKESGKISIFGILTDEFSELEKEKDFFKKIVKIIRNDKELMSENGMSTCRVSEGEEGISVARLGTIKNNHAAFVNLNKGIFSCFVSKAINVNIDEPDMKEALIKKLTNKPSSKMKMK